MLTAVKALNQAFDQQEFPDALAVKVELLPVVFPLHMFTGAMALILVPIAYALRKYPAWHRIAGRIAAADVTVAGLTAFPVAWVEPVSAWSAAGFTAQACTWLALLALAIRHIRSGRVEAHRACMLMMAATTSGAVFFRIYLALWAITAQGRHFLVFYACDAWFAWLLPLLATAVALKHWRSAAVS
jgi:uncharacterized membrane protein